MISCFIEDRPGLRLTPGSKKSNDQAHAPAASILRRQVMKWPMATASTRTTQTETLGDGERVQRRAEATPMCELAGRRICKSNALPRLPQARDSGPNGSLDGSSATYNCCTEMPLRTTRGSDGLAPFRRDPHVLYCRDPASAWVSPT